MSNLRKKMIFRMERENYSPSTVRSYVSHVSDYASYHQRCPSELGTDEVAQYLHHLVKERSLSVSTVNGAYNALRYVYEKLLGREWDESVLTRPRKSVRLPQVLSPQEVQAIMLSIKNMKHRAALYLLYSSGLRVSELVHLRIEDIDSDRMTVRIVQSKGNQDRYTILSESALKLLRSYWLQYRPLSGWLFEGMKDGSHWSVRSAQQVFYQSCQRAGIQKKVSIHTLRHSFATHMLEAGVDAVRIQQLLGHKQLKTTRRYLHLRQSYWLGQSHPLDQLFR